MTEVKSDNEIYVLCNVTYRLRWRDHGDFQDDGSGGYCSGGEGEDMEEQTVKQEKIIRTWHSPDTMDFKFSDHNLENLSYRINMCASDHASRYCRDCFQEYTATNIEYIKTLSIKRASSEISDKEKFHKNGYKLDHQDI